MASQWNPEDDEEDITSALAVTGKGSFSHWPSGQPTVTTKIPPSYDGSTLWFPYEEAVMEWNDLTELDKNKRGPALRSQLTGAAATYRHHIDRSLLVLDDGVEYFLTTLRQLFVKGVNNVFLLLDRVS